MTAVVSRATTIAMPAASKTIGATTPNHRSESVKANKDSADAIADPSTSGRRGPAISAQQPARRDASPMTRPIGKKTSPASDAL